MGVQPGTYTVRVELPSFRTLELKNKVLPTSSSLNLGSLKLAVGGLSDVVTVVADGTAIETENSATASGSAPASWGPTSPARVIRATGW